MQLHLRIITIFAADVVFIKLFFTKLIVLWYTLNL